MEIEAWKVVMGGFTALIGLVVALMGWMGRRQVERIDHLESRERDLALGQKVSESLAQERAERLIALEVKIQQQEVRLATQQTTVASRVGLEDIRGVLREELDPIRREVRETEKRLTRLESSFPGRKAL